MSLLKAYLRKTAFFILAFPSLIYGQIFNDISNPVNIRYNAVDSTRLMAGIGVLDFDNDGDDDLVLSGAQRRIKLYRNDGNFTFTDVTTGSGLDQIHHNVAALAAADFDNDGWEDLFMTTIENQPNLLLRNNQNGSFSDVSVQSGITQNQYWGMAITLGDLNGDSFLDIYVGNYAADRKRKILPSNPMPNELFISQGQAFKYLEQGEAMGVSGMGYTLAARFMDLDKDQDLDLYVANDFGSSGEQPNIYYENIEGQLSDRTDTYGLGVSGSAMGIACGDYDNDQDLDLYISDIGSNPFLENRDGSFHYINSSAHAGGSFTSWGARFMDVDKDGRLDLTMTNGGILLGEREEPFSFYGNLGGSFFELGIPLASFPFYARGMAVSDFDHDGDEDVMINTVIEEDNLAVSKIRVLENMSEVLFRKNHFLQVELVDPTGNRNALGSLLKVRLENGQTIMRSLDVGGTYLSVHSKTVHFGLGKQEVESLTIVWPNGEEQLVAKPPYNSLLSITKGAPPILIRSEETTYAPERVSPDIRVPTLVQDQIRIYLEEWADVRRVEGQVLAMTGQVLKQFKLETRGEQITIPVNLPAGPYVLNFRIRERLYTYRILVL